MVGRITSTELMTFSDLVRVRESSSIWVSDGQYWPQINQFILELCLRMGQIEIETGLRLVHFR